MMVALAQPRRALAALLDGLVSSGTDLSVSVRGVETDSRRVRDGGLFLACSGFESHGLNYVDDALKHGAAAVLWEPEPGVDVPQLNVPAWPVEQLRQHVGEIAARYYDHPSRELFCVGITGTDGKTSTAYLLAHALTRLGESAGYLGTLGYGPVDALELAFERDYVTTIVICTGDSDFTPLVQKLRELNRRVIGIGVRDSTSKLLPPACDEFLYYDSLEGVEASIAASRAPKATRAVDADDDAPAESPPLEELVISTLAGMQGSSDDVRASTLKRAITRIDPTFNEADHGFRGFTELLRHLAERKVVELSGPKRDPEVDLVTGDGPAQAAFELLVAVVADKAGKKGAALSGLKTEITRRDDGFNERALGYGGFLQFCKAAAARDLVSMAWDDARGDYLLSPAG